MRDTTSRKHLRQGTLCLDIGFHGRPFHHKSVHNISVSVGQDVEWRWWEKWYWLRSGSRSKGSVHPNVKWKDKYFDMNYCSHLETRTSWWRAGLSIGFINEFNGMSVFHTRRYHHARILTKHSTWNRTKDGIHATSFANSRLMDR